MSDRDRERPKKSWREIDAQRDGTRRSSPRPEDSRSTASADRASKQYRAELDALFAKGEVGKLAEKLAQPVRQPPGLVDAPRPKGAPEPQAAEPEKPVDDPRAVLRKKILTALGRDEISRAVDRYVKAHGLPRDFEVLEQALEHVKEDRVTEALQTLESMLAREKPKRSRTLAGKLRLLEETAGDAELRAFAARVRAML
ncbi:MAG: hypothetical protein ACHQ17_11525 [Polyangia bacterium]